MGVTLIPPEFCAPLPGDAIREQRRRHLAEAQRVRLARSVLLRRVADLPRAEGLWMVADLVDDPPEVLAGAQVETVLLAVRSVGQQQADTLLEALGLRMRPHTLRELTPRQRASLSGAVLALAARSGR